jgi:hypothetical protein
MANLRANKITSTEIFETTGSVQFDGSGDYLSLSSNDGFDFGAGSFTIEAWVYPKTLTSDILIATSNSTGGFFFGRRNSGSYIGYGRLGTAWDNSSGNDLVINQWNHIAVCRDNNSNIRVFLNGIQSGPTQSLSTSYNLNTLTIGGTTSEYYVNGHISNARILKGTALYTENFTPPTRELEVIPNTVLLACQSTTNAAEEKTGKTITVNGNAVANELTPGLLTNTVKSGGSSAITGSVEFDGTGDYLLDSTGADGFNGGVGDWTVEAWMYCSDASQPDVLINGKTSTTDRFYINFIGQTIYIGDFNINNIAIGGVKQVNSWFHVAVTKSSSTYRAFINGIQIGSSTTPLVDSNLTSLTVGYRESQNYYAKGFISNLRIIKGTALYTSNFTPPTRKLTRLPGTVLLCCQDSNNPTQEATGKTITPYGSLIYNPPELVTDGGFSSASNWPSRGADWTISGGVATINSTNSGFDFLGILAPGINGILYELKFDISNWTAGRLELSQADSSNIAVTVSGNGSYTFRFLHTGTTNGNIGLYSYTDTTASFNLDNVSLKVVPSVPKPPFVPQIGSDGSVVFDGTTKINTPNYFYLPTGPTEQRSRGRGVFGGGYIAPANVNTIDFINIQSTGNAIDFGDTSTSAANGSALGSSTRGVIGAYNTPSTVNTIEYITFATTSNSLDFGDLTLSRWGAASASSRTRGIFYSGYVTPANVNNIDYITIASVGNAIDFGDAINSTRSGDGCSSSTRGLFAGGASPSLNAIEYITIATTGNSQDFGDLTVSRFGAAATSSSTRAIFCGGYVGPAGQLTNTIDYVTMSSIGNAIDFGDLTRSNWTLKGLSNSIRGIIGGGYAAPSYNNNIDYVTIASTGNASDFGDMISSRGSYSACSDSHGGLG